MEHVYAPAIVYPWLLPSHLARKAMNRVFKGETAKIVTVSAKVITMKVGSSLGLWHPEYDLVWDRINHTYRCSCPAGFYGHACHHIEMGEEAIRQYFN